MLSGRVIVISEYLTTGSALAKEMAAYLGAGGVLMSSQV